MKKIIILTLLSSLLVAGFAIAQPGKGGCDGKRGDRHGKHNGTPMLLQMADQLELTEKQTEQIEAMAVDFKLEQIELRAEIKKEHVLMRSLKRNDDASEKEIFAKIDKISALKAESQKLKVSHKNAVQSVLTDEQTDKLKELRKNRRFEGRRGGDCDQDGFGKDRGRRGGDGDGEHRGFNKN